ncbi:hypothetical protein [Streptomyces sp. NPDC086010]|uniref:hypothetical protein n=1 Tax=Streptomyces sp. NPDC086010 TaxID=3365745 RepID=UPI0037CD90EB
MELLTALGEAVAALKAPLDAADRSQGWTDDLRREIQEDISVRRSVLRRHGLWMAPYLRPGLDRWMAQEGVGPGRLRNLVEDVQRRLMEAAGTACGP